MNHKKQTAVEWLEEQIRWCISNSDKLEPLVKQAKEMEKEQIKDAWCNGINSLSEINEDELSEQYYNETYEH